MYSLASCTKLYTVHTETKITESNKESYPASHSETPPCAPSLVIQTHIFIFFSFCHMVHDHEPVVKMAQACQEIF